MTKLYCDEHGHVMTGGLTSVTPGIEATMTMFCPICQRELFPDDPLTEIERKGEPAPTAGQWAERQDIDILRMPPIRFDGTEAA